ncbi:MAG TPA: glycosyltransferase family A protein [Ktedonobacterales bacterium]|nr:glycosyltransferase family A protein [Ktedonobacterales bacterium]
MNELVSIITPTYHCDYLPGFRRMLRSVDAQTYHHWEHLVASDGEHEDGIAEACAGNEQRHYHVIRPHSGHWGNGVRAALLEKAHGEYVCFLDDDDLMFPDYLEAMLGALHNSPQAAFAVCLMLHCGGSHKRGQIQPYYVSGELRVGSIGTPQIVSRTSAMQKVGWQHRERYEADGLTYQQLGTLYPHVRVERMLVIGL